METGYAFGRLPAPDERDHRFLMRAGLPPPPVLPDFKYWRPGPQVNQGNTGTCVGHGCYDELTCGPVTHKHDTLPSPFAIYDAATQLDEWTDNDHDTERQFGTSVRAGMKALANLGFCAQYLWAFDLQTMLDWLLVRGPVVIGVDWYTGMLETDTRGVIHATGSLEGGHCVLVYGANRRTELVRIQNSWRPDWGQGGKCWLSFEDMARLIREGGEICTAVDAPLVLVPA